MTWKCLFSRPLPTLHATSMRHATPAPSFSVPQPYPQHHAKPHDAPDLISAFLSLPNSAGPLAFFQPPFRGHGGWDCRLRCYSGWARSIRSLCTSLRQTVLPACVVTPRKILGNSQAVMAGEYASLSR